MFINQAIDRAEADKYEFEAECSKWEGRPMSNDRCRWCGAGADFTTGGWSCGSYRWKGLAQPHVMRGVKCWRREARRLRVMVRDAEARIAQSIQLVRKLVANNEMLMDAHTKHSPAAGRREGRRYG